MILYCLSRKTDAYIMEKLKELPGDKINNCSLFPLLTNKNIHIYFRSCFRRNSFCFISKIDIMKRIDHGLNSIKLL